MRAWKIERWLVHGVLVFALVMTGFTLYAYFSGAQDVLGIKTQTIQDIYGFFNHLLIFSPKDLCN